MPSIVNMTEIIIEEKSFSPVNIIFIILGFMFGFVCLFICGDNRHQSSRINYDTESISSYGSDFYDRDYSYTESEEEKPIKKGKYIIEGMEHETLETETEEICAICIEDFKIEDSTIILKCGHIYHSSCIQPWFNEQIHNDKQAVCPLCKDIQEIIFMKKNEYFDTQLQKIVSKE
jgi:hypothetical protein